MTNKEAIRVLQAIKEHPSMGVYLPDEYEALNHAIKVLEERPQGEWEENHIFSCGKILRMQLDVIEHKCKNCGRWSIKWVGTIPDNFCSYCGASIKEAKKND